MSTKNSNDTIRNRTSTLTTVLPQSPLFRFKGSKLKWFFAQILASWRRTVVKQPEWLFVDEWRNSNLSLFHRWSDPSGEGFRIRLRDGVSGAASRGVPQPTTRGSVGVLPSKGAHPRYQVSSGSHAVETLMYIYSYTVCSLSDSLLSIGTALWHSGKSFEC